MTGHSVPVPGHRMDRLRYGTPSPVAAEGYSSVTVIARDGHSNAA